MVSKQEIAAFNDEDLGLIATADAGTYPDDVLLAVWERLAAHDVVVEFVNQQAALGETPSEYLVTVATFRNYVRAQFAQTRLLSSGMQAFLFDDNVIRINWFWCTALGGVKLRVPAGDIVEALEILRLDSADQSGHS
jgi:hypothetical protein